MAKSPPSWKTDNKVHPKGALSLFFLNFILFIYLYSRSVLPRPSGLPAEQPQLLELLPPDVGSGLLTAWFALLGGTGLSAA